MVRRLLLATILATTLIGSVAAAEGEPTTENVVEAAPAFGVTLTCSARLPTAVVGCFAERPVLVVGAFELAIGVDAQVVFSDAARGHLAPYAVLAWYGETASAWVELRLPELNGLQPIGDPDFLRLGFSLRL
ncbi:MAG: hypothetical protein WC972_03130 [Trueperaceae bacterium]